MVPSANYSNCDDLDEGGSLGDDANRRPAQSGIRDQFKSYKKKSVDDHEQKMFVNLVSLLVVFATLPF